MSKIPIQKFFLYDPHSWYGEKNIKLSTIEKTYLIDVFNHFIKPMETSYFPYFLVADELSTTNLPFFFPRGRRVALLKETPIYIRKLDNNFFRKHYDLVLTHCENLIQSGFPFVRVDFSTNWAIRNPSDLLKIEKKKLVSFVGRIEHDQQEEGYSLRYDIAKMLIALGNIDCFGKGIKPIENKNEGLVDYCFSIAMENTKENYYYTEKIIDCFFTETVPIYWGCPKINEIFDNRGLITFDSSDELMAIIKNLTFEKYLKMLPYVQANKKKCIDNGLDSFESYLLRCVKVVERYLPNPEKPLGWWQFSKPMAGIRMLMERFFPNIPFSW